jgi:hypothetical protein
MTIGTAGSSGRRKPLVERFTNASTVMPSAWRARYVEQTPSNVPRPDQAGSWTTPTVMLQRSDVARGDDEIE